MILKIVDARLDAVAFDICPVLYFGRNREHEFRIEQDFTVEIAGKSSKVSIGLAPGGEHTLSHGANELVTFIHAKVSEAFANDDGSLHIVFGDIGKIDVPHHPQVEAWTYGSPDGRILVSLPGGGLG